MARDLEHKSVEELQQLASNEIAQIEMVTNDESLQAVQLEVHTAQENNKMLATENIQYGEKIPSLKTEVHRLHNGISAANEQLNQLLAQYNSLSSNSLPFDDLSDRLKITAAESDEQSEKIAEDFLNGNLQLESFLQVYKEARKNAHLSRIKAEKFSELVEEERIKRQQQSSLAQMNSSTAGVSVPGMPMNSMSYNPYLANQRANVSGGMNQQPPYPSHNPYSAYPATAVYP